MKEGRGETLDTTLYHTSDIITTLSHVGEGGYFNPPVYRCNHATTPPAGGAEFLSECPGGELTELTEGAFGSSVSVSLLGFRESQQISVFLPLPKRRVY